jgi:hypothetical protein
MRCIGLLLLMLVCMPSLALARDAIALSVQAPEEASTHALRSRVERELETRGFATVTPSEANVEAADLLLFAREANARISLSIVLLGEDDTVIEVVDIDSGKRSRRTLRTDTDEHGPSTIALAAAELVEATLLELGPLPTPAEASEPPPTAELGTRPETAERPGVQLDAAAGVLWPVRTATPVAVAIVGVGLRPSPRLTVSAEATLPFHAMRREVEVARLATYPFLVGVRTAIDVLPMHTRPRLDLQAAVTALALRIEVDAAPGVEAHPQTVWSTAGVVGLHLHGPVSPAVHLGVAVRMVVPFENIRIRAAGDAVQRLGAVWPGAAISLIGRW